MGFDSEHKRISCGGFAYLFGELRFSSVWLNGTDQLHGETDGDRYLSQPEKILVNYCWEEYKRNGVNRFFSIPDFIDEDILQ